MSVRGPEIDHPTGRRPGEGVVSPVIGEIGVTADLAAIIDAKRESPPSVPRSVIPVPVFQIKACCFWAIANGVSIKVTQMMMSNCIVFIVCSFLSLMLHCPSRRVVSRAVRGALAERSLFLVCLGYVREPDNLPRAVNSVGVADRAAGEGPEILRHAGVVTPQGGVSFFGGVAAPADDRSRQIDIEPCPDDATESLHHYDTGSFLPIEGAGGGADDDVEIAEAGHFVVIVNGVCNGRIRTGNKAGSERMLF